MSFLSSKRAPSGSFRSGFCASAILALLTIGLYFPVKDFNFINLDDNIYIIENPRVNSGLTLNNIKWAFTEFRGGHWHPLSWISHMMDVELFGLTPGGHHLVNVFLHCINAVLVFIFFNYISKRTGASFFIAAMFALHPLRLESVAWVTERKDVLSTFFILLALNFYARFTANKSLWAYAFCMFTFSLSLLAKPTYVTFPLLLLLIDFWPLKLIDLNLSHFWQQSHLRAILLQKAPFLLISAISSLITLRAQDADGGLKSLSDYTLSARVANALVNYLTYAGKLLFPTDMGIFYPFYRYPPGVGAGAALGILALSFICLNRWRNQPYLAVGWLWYLLSLLPMSGFIQFGGQAFADRWTYFPHIGLLMGLTWLANDLMHSKSAKLLLSSALLILAASHTRLNLPNWKDSETLFTHTLKVAPDNFLAYTNLGAALDEKGKLPEATQMFERAVSLRPSYAVALNDLGSAYARSGRLAEAMELFQRAVISEPTLLEARYHLGLSRVDLGDALGGIVEWAKVLRDEPGYSRAIESLNIVYRQVLDQGCMVKNKTAVENSLTELASILSGVTRQDYASTLQQIYSCYSKSVMHP